MEPSVMFTIDGVGIKGTKGQTIIQAADQAGVYIPRLCWAQNLSPSGNCRICTVLVNGRPQAACTFPISEGLVVENDTQELRNWRKSIVEMLLVEGNHFCMFCEKSGNCELQALAYRFGITAPEHPHLYPRRDVDASHPDILIDHNRCILCARCVRASRDLDGKNVFQFVNRGRHTRLAVNAATSLGDTNLHVLDEAAAICPVGAILTKRVGYCVPIGERLYDRRPIGSAVTEKELHTAGGEREVNP